MLQSLILCYLCSLALGLQNIYPTVDNLWVAPLKRVLVRRPDENFNVGKNYKQWHYTSAPVLAKAHHEHDQFVHILKQNNIEVIYHEKPLLNHADSIFIHDPILITDKGAIILKMGKKLREEEENAVEEKIKQLQIPILHKLKGNATAEGGDLLWLDSKTLAIGRGFRTNDEGIQQIKTALNKNGTQVLIVDLPYDQGPKACLHLQSLISLVDYKMAVVYRKYLPVSFIHHLEKNGYTLIDVPESEYNTMGPNILALAPKVVLTLEGNKKTKAQLERSGCKVFTYVGNEISRKAEGGATCLTRPLLRVF